MRIIAAKDYNDMSRKAAEYHFRTGHYEARLCSGSCNRFFSGWNLQAAD